MTLTENLALRLEQCTDLGSAEIQELVSLKLSLVGLGGFEEFYLSEIRRNSLPNWKIPRYRLSYKEEKQSKNEKIYRKIRTLYRHRVAGYDGCRGFPRYRGTCCRFG